MFVLNPKETLLRAQGTAEGAKKPIYGLIMIRGNKAWGKRAQKAEFMGKLREGRK